ncbi:MAG TPA: DNA integrity scanning protein DisA nucleotide-binding domain protein [Candidatus Omnitrophota bacterium]|jgi:hypothetical protein|nr:DNA integrity scanning protein DisA nucleotide-binding domain protein [Candidatus Omnitrophota bacterium]HPW77571.1 DNA integrity scanning protein DisA nucleotide-binding domain protein [Candidatus Omnitrophota bacterium]HQB12600.1 DNA integrity scanning protein DisA nucleotide-binding domain protein [Candidatus Omnitrophota bacterium]
MLITIIAALIGLGYFFYPPRFAWVRASVKYLIGVFCFWAALVFARPEVQEPLWRGAGVFILLIAGLLLLLDGVTAFSIWIADRVSLLFKRKLKLPGYLEEINTAFHHLAARKVGALIVLQQSRPLKSHMRGPGLPFDAEIRSEILIPLFLTTSPVHDGAVIVHKGRIQTVKAILPLATLVEGHVNFGTRHRAAIGITERTDAVAMVVSEERGEISIASDGCLVRIPNQEEFVRVMNWLLKGRSILKLKGVRFVITAKVLEDFA